MSSMFIIFCLRQVISAEIDARNGHLMTLEAKVAETAAEFRSPELTILAKEVAGLKWKQENLTQKVSKVWSYKYFSKVNTYCTIL